MELFAYTILIIVSTLAVRIIIVTIYSIVHSGKSSPDELE